MMENLDEPYFPAIRLLNNQDGTSTFEIGKMLTYVQAQATTFWLANHTEEWEKSAHPAPRKQYVVTISGVLQFKVSDGSTFEIKPGIILLAEDIAGEGHSWEMINDTKIWERIYIPIADGVEDHFIPD